MKGGRAKTVSMELIVLIVLSALIALLGRNRKIGYGWSLFFCLFLSPLIGLIIILCSKKKQVEFEAADLNNNNNH